MKVLIYHIVKYIKQIVNWPSNNLFGTETTNILFSNDDINSLYADRFYFRSLDDDN